MPEANKNGGKSKLPVAGSKESASARRIVCPECGMENAANAEFCKDESCGFPLAAYGVHRRFVEADSVLDGKENDGDEQEPKKQKPFWDLTNLGGSRK